MSVSAAIKLVLTALVLGMVAWKIDFSSAARVLASLAWTSALVAVLLVVLQAASAAVRLTKIVEIVGARLPIGSSFRVTLESMFFAQTFVSVLGGDVLRIWRIRLTGVRLQDATSMVVLDRILGIIVNHVLLLATLPFVFAMIADDALRVALSLLAAAGVAGTLLLLLLGFYRDRFHAPAWLDGSTKVRKILAALVESSTVAAHVFVNFRRLLLPGLLALVIALINCVIFFVLLRGLGFEAALAIRCAVLVPAIIQVAMLPISVAGWGIREAAVVLGFGALGVEPHMAFGVSLAFGLVILAVSLIGGMLWLADRRELTPAVISDGRAKSSGADR